MIFLLSTHIRPLIEYCSCIWHTGFTQDLKLLENVQRRWTKQIDGLSSLSYGERLKSLNLYSIQGRLLRADLIQCWKIFNGHSCISPADIFQQPYQNRTRGHCYKIFPPVTNTDIRKRFFTIRCIHVWNSLPASTVCASSLTVFKNHLHHDIREALYAYAEWLCTLRHVISTLYLAMSNDGPTTFLPWTYSWNLSLLLKMLLGDALLQSDILLLFWL